VSSPRVSRRPRRLPGLAGLAIAATVQLSGCGAGSGFNPGVAARVGDDTVTVDRVDDVTESYCGAAEGQLQGKALPNHYLRGQVAGSLALRSAADQLLDQYGVQADQMYDQAVAQAEKSLTDLSADQRDALIEVQGAQTYVNAAEISIGRELLAARGRSGASDDEATAAGKKAMLAWLDDHDVRLDPRFGVTLDKGQVAPTDTSLSYALGDTSKKADAAQPDREYAAALPETHRCG
jgi:peptidyl-prolyl cis-trans isomerase SurA